VSRPTAEPPSTLRHPRRAALVVAAVLGTTALGACRTGVGDSCVADIECDRPQVCDTASPGGYCTIYDCDLDTSCPQGSVCVVFELGGDRAVAACMDKCEHDGQCRERDGYVCRAESDDGPTFCGAPDPKALWAFDSADTPPPSEAAPR